MQVALFDIDGTLYPHDSELTRDLDGNITDFVAEVLGVPAEEASRIRQETLRSHGTTLRGMIELHGVDPGDFYRFITIPNMSDYLKPDPQLTDMLGSIHGELIAFTNGHKLQAHGVLRALDLESAFGRVYTIEDSGYLGKPNIEVYEQVLGDLGVPAESATMVEDTVRFLRPAKDLGMRVVLVGQRSLDADDSSWLDGIGESVLDLPSVAPWLFS